MNRREFLQCAAVLVSGASVAQIGFSLTSEQLVYLAAAPDYISTKKEFFSAAQRRLVAAIAETIIPRTDTPGAIDAGVPHFIELMVSDWLTDQERATFITGLEQMASGIPRDHGNPFEELGEKQRIAILEAMEEAAADSSWYVQGNVRQAFISDAPFLCQIKELTVWGFFTSEQGATKTLRYDVMPMRFDGDVPLAPEQSSWASFRF